jgi:hypothetical protein
VNVISANQSCSIYTLNTYVVYKLSIMNIKFDYKCSNALFLFIVISIWGHLVVVRRISTFEIKLAYHSAIVTYCPNILRRFTYSQVVELTRSLILMFTATWQKQRLLTERFHPRNQHRTANHHRNLFLQLQCFPKHTFISGDANTRNKWHLNYIE